MNRIAAIAVNTFRESVRERILVIAAVFGAVLMGGSLFLSPLAVGAKQKIVMDVGLAAISIIGVLTAIFLGGTLVHKEIDRRAIYLVLARPVPRPAYIVGKLAGIVLAASLIFASMTAVLVAALVLGGRTPGPAVFAAVYLSLLETAVVASIVVFFSTFTTPMLASFFTLCVFVAGSLSGDLRVFAERFGGAGTRVATNAFYYLLPNLKVFNLRHAAVHDLAFSAGDLALATGYAAVYVAVVVYFACLVFRRREFA